MEPVSGVVWAFIGVSFVVGLVWGLGIGTAL